MSPAWNTRSPRHTKHNALSFSDSNHIKVTLTRALTSQPIILNAPNIFMIGKMLYRPMRAAHGTIQLLPAAANDCAPWNVHDIRRSTLAIGLLSTSMNRVEAPTRQCSFNGKMAIYVCAFCIRRKKGKIERDAGNKKQYCSGKFLFYVYFRSRAAGINRMHSIFDLLHECYLYNGCNPWMERIKLEETRYADFQYSAHAKCWSA